MFHATILVATFGEGRDELFQDVCVTHGFGSAKGFPVNKAETWGATKEIVLWRLNGVARQLKENHFILWQYVVSETLYDSRNQDDPLRLL